MCRKLNNKNLIILIVLYLFLGGADDIYGLSRNPSSPVDEAVSNSDSNPVKSRFVSKKLQERTVKISISELRKERGHGVIEALFSESGKFLTVATLEGFVILPSGSLLASAMEIANTKEIRGNFLGFLPSDLVLFSTTKGTFTLNPETGSVQKILKQVLENPIFYNHDLVIVSDSLAISGYGNVVIGMPGSIQRLNLASSEIIDGADIPAFGYAMISPDRRYIAFKYSLGESYKTLIYNISADIVIDITKTGQAQFSNKMIPLGWTDKDRLLIQYYNEIEFDNTDKSYINEPKILGLLALADIKKNDIIWTTKIGHFLYPTDFNLIDNCKAVLSFPKKQSAVELDLSNGKLLDSNIIKSNLFAINAENKRFAFIEIDKERGQRVDKIKISFGDINGNEIEHVIIKDKNWAFREESNSIRIKPPYLSPDGKEILLFGKNSIIIYDME